MWNGKTKAITFSYDDGVVQDERLIKILDKYGLKSTFNINTGFAGKVNCWKGNGNRIYISRIPLSEINEVYKNHEVAVHTVHHKNLTLLSEEEKIEEIKRDKETLEDLLGKEVVGMAYPCGGKNYDESSMKVAKSLGIRYSRTIESTGKFDLQRDLMKFNPTVYHCEMDKMKKLADEFINIKTDEPKLFYIWGHSYEFDWGEMFDTYSYWDRFEKFCQKISGKDDIFYGTNEEVFFK